MKLDCGDNSCYFMENGKGGMRTNGGCRCFNDPLKRVEIRKRLQLFEKMRNILLDEIEWSFFDDGEKELTYLDLDKFAQVIEELRSSDVK